MKDTTKHVSAAQRDGEAAAESAAENAAETGRRVARAGEDSLKEAGELGSEIADKTSRTFRKVAERGSDTVRQMADRGGELARENLDRGREIFKQQSDRAGEVAANAANLFAGVAKASRRDMNVLVELGTIWNRSLQEFSSAGFGAPQQSLDRIAEAVRSVRDAQSELVRETTTALLKANAHLSEVYGQMAQEALERIETANSGEDEEDGRQRSRRSAQRA